MKRLMPIAILIIFLAAGCSGKGKTGAEKMKEADVYLQSIVVNQLEMVNEQGQAWDGDGSGPDIRVALIPHGTANYTLMTETKNNVRAVNLPVNWDVGNRGILLSGNSWALIMYDQDDNEMQQMMSWDFSGDAGGENITLKGDDDRSYEVILNLERRLKE